MEVVLFQPHRHHLKHLRVLVRCPHERRLRQVRRQHHLARPSMASHYSPMALQDLGVTVHSRTIKDGSQLGGSAEKTTWAGHTTSIIILAQQLGIDHQLTTPNASKEARWRRTCRWREELTKTECFQKTARARVRQVCQNNQVKVQRTRMQCR